MDAGLWGRVEGAAKAWGLRNGFRAAVGGWVYDSRGRPVAQGWWAFAMRYRVRASKDLAGSADPDVVAYLRDPPGRPRYG